MPRIFIDTSSVQADGSGTGRYAKAVSRAVQQSPEHQLITADPTWRPDADSPFQAAHDYHRLLNVSWLANRTNIPADVCLFPNYFMPFLWPYPSAVCIHDLSFLSHPQFYSTKMRAFYTRRLRHSIKRANLILTVSEASKAAIKHYLQVDESRIVQHSPAPPVDLGAALEVRPPEVFQDGRPYLMYIGNLEPKKNVERTLQGFNRISEAAPGRFGLLVSGKMHGSPRWNQRVQRLIARSPDAHYAGYMSESGLHAALKHASGLVLLSHVEGFGLPLLDALANRIPALISRDAALQEVAAGHALSADENSIESIQQGMENLLYRPCPPERTSSESLLKAAGYAEKQYGQAAYIRNLEQIIDRLYNQTLFFSLSSGRPGRWRSSVIRAVAYAAVFKSGINTQKLFYSLDNSCGPLAYAGFRERLSRMSKASGDGPVLLKQHRPEVWRLPLPECYAGDQEHLKNDLTHQNTALVISHKPLLRRLARLPWIRGLYFSGGTLHGSGLDDCADLDLFIVCSPDRVWLCYAAIRLLSKISGKGASLCSNYLVDETAHEIQWQQDYYSAFQLLFLKKVVLKPGVRHIRQANAWVYDSFPNHPRFAASAPNAAAAEKTARNGLLSLLNIGVMSAWTYFWRREGLQSGTGGLLWDAHRIKLHTHDHRPFVKRRFAQIMKKFRAYTRRDKTPKRKYCNYV